MFACIYHISILPPWKLYRIAVSFGISGSTLNLLFFYYVTNINIMDT